MIVVFDWDNTLVDSLDVHVNAFLEAFKRFGINADKKDIAYLIKERALRNKEIIEKYDLNKVDEILKIKKKLVLDNIDGIKKMKGADEILEYLKKKGYKIGIASSANTDLINKVLKNFGWEKYVDYVLGDRDVENPKPNPEILLKMLKISGEEEGVYVGDNIIDFITGLDAGFKVHILGDDLESLEDLKKYL